MPAVTIGSLRARWSPSSTADACVVVSLYLLAMLQSPGRTSFDTKLDLVVDPGVFLGRAIGAWDPLGGFGQVQNQAYGYLWPMGPFFAVGQGLGLAGWVVQGLWAGTLLALAYLGARVLGRRLGFGAVAALAAGLVYAVSPRMLTTLGPISAEALTLALVPWTIVPLARSTSGDRRAAFLSALAVFGMGAANAALTVAVLPLPLLWIVTRCRWRLLGWWGLFVALFCLWWVVPLLVLASYSPDFLLHVETAATTTGVVGPLEALRGATHWVAYFVRNGEPWWPTGYRLATGDWLVPVTAVVAGLGLAGLTMRRMPARWVWLSSLLLGLSLLVVGADAPPGSPFQDSWRQLLDGPLVAFRNIHKFDPLVRLPLSLGFGWLVGLLWNRARLPELGRLPRLAGQAAIALTAVAVVVAGSPLLLGQIRAVGGWTDLPAWWPDTARYLASQGGTGRALLLPASGFGEYQWGRAVDEPLQPLARSPWAQDNALPLGAVGTSRLLDSVNRLLETGRPSASLAPLLARSGVTHLVVRNDLDWAVAGSPPPALVHATLDRSAGVRKVMEFGPDVGPAAGSRLAVSDFGVNPQFPAVEIYRVDQPAPTVDAVAWDDVVGVSGGSESLLGLLEAGLLASDQPAVLLTDPGSADVSGQLLTDGLRRRDRTPGRIQGSLSVTQTADEPSRLDRRLPDLLPWGALSRRTVAQPQGIASVEASSSMGYADSVVPVDPSLGPFSAVDGNSFTWWQSGDFGGAVGEWLEITFDEATDVSGGSVDLVVSQAVGPAVNRVRVSTDHAAWDLDVDVATGNVRLPSGMDPTHTLRLTVAGVAGPADQGFVGIREVWVPGVRATRPLLLPGPGMDAGPVFGVLMEVDTPRRGACVLVAGSSRCDPSLVRGSEEPVGIDRLLDLEQPWRGSWSGWGLPRPGAATARLFDPIGPAIRASATSWLDGDVAVRPSAAVDGDDRTAWVADVGDPDPVLTLRLPEPRRVSSLRLVNGPAPVVSLPTRVEVSTDQGTVVAPVTLTGTVFLPPGRTDTVRIRFLGWNRALSKQSSTGFTFEAPLGVSEIVLQGAADLVYHPDLGAATGAACGLGPALVVDGQTRRTKVTGTLGEVLAGGPLGIRPCGSAVVDLQPGRHRVRLVASETVAPSGLAFAAAPDPVVTHRSTQVISWRPASREVEIGPGGTALLRVAESANPGWVAELAGRRLPAVVVDGWQQGWQVPAGAGGSVVLTFEPDEQQRAGLLAGVLAILTALVLGCWPRRDQGAGQQRPPERVPGRLPTWLIGLGFGFVAGGVLGLAAVTAALVAAPLLRPAPMRVVVAPVLVLAAVWVTRTGASIVPDSVASLAVLAAVVWPVAAFADDAGGPTSRPWRRRPRAVSHA